MTPRSRLLLALAARGHAVSASNATSCLALDVISTCDSLLSTMYASSSAVRWLLMHV